MKYDFSHIQGKLVRKKVKLASLPFVRASIELEKKGWKLAELPDDVIGDNDMIDPLTRKQYSWEEALKIQQSRDKVERSNASLMTGKNDEMNIVV
jgi:hypothetical protein